MPEFDPNKDLKAPRSKKNHDYRYATYVPSRNPKFKVHGTSGLAFSAIRTHGWWSYSKRLASFNSDVLVFRKDGETWLKLKRLKVEPPNGELPWVE